MKNIIIITKSKFQKRDYDRFGVTILSKYFNIEIYDLSKILSPISNTFYKDLNYKNLHYINNIFHFINLLKKKNYFVAIDYLENSPYEIIFRLVLKINNIKIVKFLGGVKPKIFYGDLKFNKKINFLKNLYFSFKGVIASLLNKSFIDIVMVSAKNFFYQKSLVGSVKKKIFTNTYDYNEFLSISKNKPVKKRYFVYIDQNFINHPDFLIKKREPFVDISFYNSLEFFFRSIEKKYRIKVIISLHPKTTLKNKIFKNYSRISRLPTSKLIKNCTHVFAHYSTAISFAVLFKKPMTFLTSNRLKKIRPGYQTKIMSELLQSQLINIDGKIINITKSLDKKSYLSYEYNYVKHPNSNKKNSWITLSEYLIKLK